MNRIETQSVNDGDVKSYNLGDYYFGTTLSTSTIQATIGNGVGNDSISYNFGAPVSTTCNFVILDETTAVAYLDNKVDLFNDGNATNVLCFDIVEVGGQACFVLRATYYGTNYAYYVAKAAN